MDLIPWRPFGEISPLRKEIDNLLRSFLGQGRLPENLSMRLLGPIKGRPQRPRFEHMQELNREWNRRCHHPAVAPADHNSRPMGGGNERRDASDEPTGAEQDRVR